VRDLVQRVEELELCSLHRLAPVGDKKVKISMEKAA
jgi:hypothetical protein